MATKTSAATWKQRHAIASQNQSSMFQKFGGWYDLLYAHMNTSQYALWRSKVFLPIIPSKAWSMIARLQALQPGFEVGLYGDSLNDPDAQGNGDKMQWKLEHDWDNPCFDEPMSDKVFSPLVDAVVTGTGIAKVPWTFESQTRYEHADDPDIENGLDMTKDVKIEGMQGYNDLIPHDIMGVFFSPGAKSLQTARWVILEDYVTYDELKAVNDSAGVEVYKNLSQVKDLKSTSDQNAVYKKARERLTSDQDNISSDTTVQQFKRYECYEKDTGFIYTFAAGQTSSGDSDEWIELHQKGNPFWHGKYPLVMFYIKKRPHSVWGQGIFEDTERMQSAFNDVFNHFMDQLNMTDGMIMKQEGEVYSYTVEPGGEFLYKDKPPAQFKFPEPNPNLFNMALNFMEQQVEDSTISAYAQGTPQSAQDKTHGTAAGILALQNAAGDKIGAMKQNFSTTMREIGRMWLSNNQQFVDKPITLMGQEKGVPTPVDIQPKNLQGRMVLRINDASMEPESKEQQLTNFQAYLQGLEGLKQASIQQAQMTKWTTQPIYLDYAALAVNLSSKFNQSNIDKIMLGGDEVQKLMQASQAPFVPPKGNTDLNQLYGSEAAALLQREGIQADPRRQTQVPVDKDGNPINPVDRQQFVEMGLPVYGRDSMPSDQGGDVAAPGTPQTDGQQPPLGAQITPDHLLQAGQQDHQQAMDKGRLALDVLKQRQAEQAAQQQAQQPRTPVAK